MTTRWRDPTQKENELCAWIRDNPRLDSVKHSLCRYDCDILLHKYANPTRSFQAMMWIEFKQFGADMSIEQRDTFWKLSQMFEPQWKRVQNLIRTPKEACLLWWGVHKLRIAGAEPASSEWITWDHEPINLYDLECLLRFELDPTTIQPVRESALYKEALGVAQLNYAR